MQAESCGRESRAGGGAGGERIVLSATYGARFRCIGPECEDLCCRQWEIPVDAVTYGRWRELSRGRLREDIDRLVQIDEAACSPALYASIARRASGDCSLLDEECMCSVQRQLGAELLPAACSIYPRSLARVGARLEVSLSLSCPEAARGVLLDEEFLNAEHSLYIDGDAYVDGAVRSVDGDMRSGTFRTDNFFGLRGRGTVAVFDEVRRAVVACVRDRSQALEVRLLRIGAFCVELDAASNEAEIAAACVRLGAKTSLEAAMSAKGDERAKIEMVFDLSAVHVEDPSCTRFAEVLLQFAQGLSRLPNEVRSFVAAEREVARPFFAARPHVLENLVLNHMMQTLFPFGREGSGDFFTRSAWEEYVQMTVRYAWVRALLTGVAGCFGAAFCEAHVVQTVQSLTRAIEHYPRVLASLHEYLRERGRDDLCGVAGLLMD